MLRFKVHLENPHRRSIEKAREVLENDGLIIYPTDTVYGIGCSLYNKRALERLYRLKCKSKFDPVSIIVQDIRQASQYAKISNSAFRVLRHCLPGPYTFILPATREIPINALQKPLVNTSVNLEAGKLLNDPDEIEKIYNHLVDLMLDAGWLSEAEESTICSLVNDEINVLREGKGDIYKLFEK